MTKIAVINCYDSFVFNLVELLRHEKEVAYQVINYNNMIASTCHSAMKEDLTPKELVQQFDGILLSPGPATPEDFPLLSTLIRLAEGETTLLGVCLGMQALAHTYGASLQQLDSPCHGFEDTLIIEEQSPFLEGITTEDRIGRYHSWAVDRKTLPPSLQILATAQSDQATMAIGHRKFPFYGVQFHPESFISTHSATYLRNWLRITQEYNKVR